MCMCTSIILFTAALSTIAKIRKQPRCPSTDAWMKMWSICTTEYYSAVRKNETVPCAAACMQLEITILHKVRKRKTNSTISLIWSLNMTQTNLSMKQKHTHTYRTGAQLPREFRRGMEWEGGLAEVSYYIWSG